MTGRLAKRLARWAASAGTVDLRLVVAVVALAALILGYIGLAQYVPRQPSSAAYGDSWDDILFYDLQLYTLSAAPAAGPGPFPVWLAIARFLAPAGTLLAALAALRLVLADQFRRYLAAHARDHAIVAGDGPIALTLARKLRNGTSYGQGEGKKVVLVSPSEDMLAEARRYGMLTVLGDPLDGATLAAAGVAGADELYACGRRGTVNADIAVLAGQAAAGRKQPLSAYVLVSSAGLGVELRARRIGVTSEPGLELDFFTLEASAARKLLDDYPLDWSTGPAQVLLIGFGPFGQAVLREIAMRQLARRGGPRAEVFIRSVAAPDVQNVADAFPAIGWGCAFTCGEELKLPDTGEYTVFVCPEDDDDALRESMDVARHVADGRGHVVTCIRESSPFARNLVGHSRFVAGLGGKTSVFEVIEEACTPANIRDDAFTELLAHSIHEDYTARSRARGETETTNPSTVPWDELTRTLRLANVAQAAGIGAKLEMINAVVVPQSSTVPEFRFTHKEIEELAELEHERWVRERIAQGWTYGDRRDDRRKVHPDLVENWADLAEGEREKDRDAVRRIPEILHAAGFQILRLPSNQLGTFEVGLSGDAS
jgi:hypothetical protein